MRALIDRRPAESGRRGNALGYAASRRRQRRRTAELRVLGAVALRPFELASSPLPHPTPPPPYSLRLPPARLSFLPSFHRRQRRPRADSGNVVGIKEKRRRRRPCVASPEVCAECGWSKTRPSTHPVANPHACPGEAAAVCLCGPPSVRVAAWQLRLNYARHRAIDPRFEIQTLQLTPAAPRCRCARQQSAILY